MKTNRILYIIVSCVLLFSGCSDEFLKEKEMYQQATEQQVFSTETQTNLFISNIYYKFFNSYTRPDESLVGQYSIDMGYSSLTEEKGGMSQLINNQYTLSKASDCSTYIGAPITASVANSPYTRIRECNYLLDNIDTYGKGNLDSTFIVQAKGQMLVLRAMQYLDLLRMYGGVPLVTKYTQASDTTKLPRASVTACVSQILTDLNTAAGYLPAQWSNVSTDYGRLTSAAALALESRVLLTYASPIFNTDWNNTADPRWTEALAVSLKAEKKLTAAGYGLYGSSITDWDNMFQQGSGGSKTFNKEALIIRLCSGNTSMTSQVSNGWENAIRLKSQNGSGGISVPEEMVDIFPMADGSSTAANSMIKNGSLTFFLNRDPRFYRTFAFAGSQWNSGTGSVTDTVWAYRWMNGSYYTGSNSVSSPVFVRKMSYAKADLTNITYSYTDIMDYRYAELLLNIAECYAATNDVPDCLAYIGKVRARVGIPSANNYGLGNITDKNAAIAACLKERQIELAYEGKRFWDIKRWLLYDGGQGTPQLSTTNTCTALGVNQLNGTSRTGVWLTTQSTGTAKSDPIIALRSKVVPADPTSSSFSSQLSSLATFYQNNFKYVALSTPMDNNTVSGKTQAATISWLSRYYMWGFTLSILNDDTWFTQTIGWLDANSSAGTFNYQDTNNISDSLVSTLEN